MNVQTYQPDTCECLLIFGYEPVADGQDIVPIPLEEYTNPAGEHFATKRCAVHQIADLVELHNAAWHDDNKRKNIALGEVLAQLPAEDKIDHGNGHVEFKKKPTWHFDEQRNLVIDLGKDKVKAPGAAPITTSFGDRVTII